MTKLYRVTIPVTHMDDATRFYRGLLCKDGERISPGWHYFDFDGLTLACHDALADGETTVSQPQTEPLFIAVDELLAQVRGRAIALGAKQVDPDIRLLPTREEGFFLSDPFGNRLCLVKALTVQRGRHPAPDGARQGAKRHQHVLLFQQEFLNAVKGGELARVKELLMMDPDLAYATDAAGISVLLVAAYKRNARVANYLLSYRDELTLWEAAAVGHRERLAMLLEADRSQINSPAQDGYIPIGLACFFGHPECVLLLIEHGADVNAVSRNAMRLRPLHSAVTHHDEDKAAKIVSLLLRSGADVNATQERGYTALHRAADRGSAELVRLLLKAGADVSIRADNQRTASELAALKGYPEIAELLGAVPVSG